jgi:DNA mismatch repair protein MutL
LYEGTQSTDRIADRIQTDLHGDEEILRAEDVESCALWQYGGKYILLPSATGLVLVNQHRAHAAVLRAQFLEQLGMTQGAMQQLLFPEVLELSQDELVLVHQLLPDLQAIGFDMEQLTPNSYAVQGIPAQLANQSALPVLQHILSQVRERGANTQAEWREQIAQSLAQSAAIPYGKVLTEPEMRDIVTRLVQLPSYRRTADGKIIVSLLTDEEINRRFS